MVPRKFAMASLPNKSTISMVSRHAVRSQKTDPDVWPSATACSAATHCRHTSSTHDVAARLGVVQHHEEGKLVLGETAVVGAKPSQVVAVPGLNLVAASLSCVVVRAASGRP